MKAARSQGCSSTPRHPWALAWPGDAEHSSSLFLLQAAPTMPLPPGEEEGGGGWEGGGEGGRGERERENASTHARREPPRISTSSVGSAAGASLSRALLQAGQSEAAQSCVGPVLAGRQAECYFLVPRTAGSRRQCGPLAKYGQGSSRPGCGACWLLSVPWQAGDLSAHNGVCDPMRGLSQLAVEEMRHRRVSW